MYIPPCRVRIFRFGVFLSRCSRSSSCAALGFGPALLDAVAYDRDWLGPAVRGVGVGIAVCSFVAAVVAAGWLTMAWVMRG
jgi:hypothetical protein